MVLDPDFRRGLFPFIKSPFLFDLQTRVKPGKQVAVYFFKLNSYSLGKQK